MVMLSNPDFEDLLKTTAAGVTEGVLNWTKKEIKELVKKFKNRDIAFIEDSETIEKAKEFQNTPETQLFKQFVIFR